MSTMQTETRLVTWKLNLTNGEEIVVNKVIYEWDTQRTDRSSTHVDLDKFQLFVRSEIEDPVNGYYTVYSGDKIENLGKFRRLAAKDIAVVPLPLKKDK